MEDNNRPLPRSAVSADVLAMLDARMPFQERNRHLFVSLIISIMPVVFRYRGYRFFFYSNEGDPREPLHIH